MTAGMARRMRWAARSCALVGAATALAACGSGGGAGTPTTSPGGAAAVPGTGVCAYVSAAEAQDILGQPVAQPTPGDPNTSACDYHAAQGSTEVLVEVDVAANAQADLQRLTAGATSQPVSGVGDAAACQSGPPATLYVVAGHNLVTVTAPDCDTATGFAQKALARVH